MTSRAIKGEFLQCEEPEWEPLLELLKSQVDEFMWMHEVELRDGTRVHAYKHYWTRLYLHLTADGRAFVFCQDGRYRRVDAREMLPRVVDRSRYEGPCRE